MHMHQNERRQFLQSVTAAGLAAGTLIGSSTTAAQSPPSPGAASAPLAIPPGTLGPASAGPGRPKIALLVHPRMVLQDFIGPLTVFNILGAEIHLVWKKREAVMTEVGLPVMPTTLFPECPDNLDVLFSPGGLEGTIACIEDPEVLAFMASRGKTARYVTSDCTGSLLLGAAGLLRGYKAASHWSVIDQLSLYGAIPTHQRVVHDRNRLTGGGVTAGIDFGLTLAALLRDQARAEAIQLIIEYAPAPPFNAGLPETAPKDIHDAQVKARAPVVERARQLGLAFSRS
jgi:cyclohexyl-isocyanide hydratase